MQKFEVILDTGSSILWIPGEEYEEENSKILHRYNHKSSITSVKTNHKFKKINKKSFKKRALKFLSLERVISILEGPTRTKEEKEKKMQLKKILSKLL